MVFMISCPLSIMFLSVGTIGFIKEKNLLKDNSNKKNYVSSSTSIKKANNMISGGTILTVMGILTGLTGFLVIEVSPILFSIGFILSVPLGTPLIIYGLAERARAKEHNIEIDMEFSGTGFRLHLCW